MKTKLTVLFILCVLAVMAIACSAPSASAPQGKAESVLSQDEARTMIDNALQALNSGDYSSWSNDWDNDMKAAIKEKDFQAYRNQVIDQYGQYVSLESVEIQPGLQTGNVRWVAIADFEKGKIKYSFGFPSDGRLIRGIFPEAVE